MRVNNVSVRYSRTRQPAKYEEAGGLVEFSAVLEENVEADADYKAVATRLFGEAKTIVLTELALIPAGANASAHAVVAAAAPVAAPAGEQRRATDKPAGDKPETPAAKKKREALEAAALAAEQAKNNPPAAAGPGDIPVDDAPAAKPAETALGRTLPAAKVEPAGPGDIPVDDAPAVVAAVVTAATPQQVASAAAPGVATAADVQKYITSCLVAKKFLPNVILGKLKNDYKVDRVYDLKPDDLAKFHAQVKALAGEG